MSINLRKVEDVAAEFKTVENLNKELKRVASVKCRLRQMKYVVDYDKRMTAVLKEEQVLKEAKLLLMPKGTPTTMYTQKDVDILDYESTLKAIKSIQSKKCLSKAGCKDEAKLEHDPEFEDYRNACNIESMLQDHLATIKPVDNAIKKNELKTVLDTIESSGELTQERMLEMLKKLLE